MGINVFTASGRIGNDMDVRYTQNGKCIGTFSLPVESGFGENKKTAWVSCKVLGERAAKLAQYLTKGGQVTVTGTFQLDEWEKDGVKHSKPVIIVNDIQLPANTNNSGGGSMQQAQPQQQQRPQQAQQQQRPQQQQQPQNSYNKYDDFGDSDIPF